MTDDVEGEVEQLMGQVENRGRALAAIEQGFQEAEIERSAYRVALKIDHGERTVVGLNKFTLARGNRSSCCEPTPRSRQTSANALSSCAINVTTRLHLVPWTPCAPP